MISNMKEIMRELSKLFYNKIEYAFSGYAAYYYFYNETDGPEPRCIDIDCVPSLVLNAISKSKDFRVYNINTDTTAVNAMIRYKDSQTEIRLNSLGAHRLKYKQLVEDDDIYTYSYASLIDNAISDFVCDKCNYTSLCMILKASSEEFNKISEIPDLILNIITRHPKEVNTAIDLLKGKVDISNLILLCNS